MATKDFNQRHDELTAKIVDLTAEAQKLMAEIKATRQHFKGFRRLKETYFRLDRLSRRNGSVPTKRTAGAVPNNEQFKRQDAAPIKREAAAPKAPAPRLFDRTAPKPEAEMKIKNRNINRTLFAKGSKSPDIPTPPKPAPKPPKAKGKVLASSTTQNPEGDE